MDSDFEAYLRVGDSEVDRRDVDLLRSVAREGSLNAGAGALGRSYSRAHARISSLEAALGPLVDRKRGGSGGGGSQLTDRARDLIARFDRLVAALEGTAMVEKVELTGDVVEREGTLATVETHAGRVQALLAEPADRVRVTFRADAVTLFDPAGAPDTAASSVRNRFTGTVTEIDVAEATATVSVDVGASTPLAVQVTRESLDELNIETGGRLVAAVKATATRATPLP